MYAATIKAASLGDMVNSTHFASDTPVQDIPTMLSYLRANPQLHSFKAQIDWNQNYLQQVNDICPNIEHLEIEYLYPNSIIAPTTTPIRFQNVKTFSLSLINVFIDLVDDIRNTLTAIEFDHLESFKLSMNMPFSKDFLIDLIIRNRDLNSVSLEVSKLTCIELVRLVESLPKLKELAVTVFNRDEILDLHRFLMRTTHLDKVLVSTDSFGLRMLRSMEDSLRQGRLIHESTADWEKLVVFEKKST